MQIAPILLAAGAGRRFGADKRMARLPSGEALLEASLQIYLQVFGRCLVVVDRADRAVQARLQAPGTIVVEVEGLRSGRPGAGIGDSLAAGASAASTRGYGACLVALADMPLLRAGTLVALASALADSPMVAPVYRGRRGHPVGFGAQFFPSLCRLRGDSGARKLVQRHSDQLFLLPVEDEGVVFDVDVPEDLARLHGRPDGWPVGP